MDSLLERRRLADGTILDFRPYFEFDYGYIDMRYWRLKFNTMGEVSEITAFTERITSDIPKEHIAYFIDGLEVTSENTTPSPTRFSPFRSLTPSGSSRRRRNRKTPGGKPGGSYSGTVRARFFYSFSIRAASAAAHSRARSSVSASTVTRI
jgi:hypothetical protein